MEFHNTRLHCICVSMNDPNLRMSLISTIIKEYDIAMKKISENIENNDLINARKECHKIIGQFKNVGIEFNPEIHYREMEMSDIITFLELIVKRRPSISYELIQYITKYNIQMNSIS